MALCIFKVFAREVVSCAKASNFSTQPHCVRVQNKFTSLVRWRQLEAPVDGDGEVSEWTAFVCMHWDDYEAKVGRLVRLDSANRLKYTVPPRKHNSAEDFSSGSIGQNGKVRGGCNEYAPASSKDGPDWPSYNTWSNWSSIIQRQT